MKIYTRKGDRGTTALVGGRRVEKDDPRVEAYGTIDELSAQVACLRDHLEDEAALAPEYEELGGVLGELMTAAALLALDEAAPQEVKAKMPRITPAAIARLEESIDRISAMLPAVRHFTLPGGHPLVSLSHVCRTVCRRAERRCVTASRDFAADGQVLAYINRLSDYFYVLGRRLALHFNIREIPWMPGE